MRPTAKVFARQFFGYQVPLGEPDPTVLLVKHQLPDPGMVARAIFSLIEGRLPEMATTQLPVISPRLDFFIELI